MNPANIKDFLFKIPGKIQVLFTGIKDYFFAFLDELPAGKKKVLLASLSGFTVLLIIIIVVSSGGNNNDDIQDRFLSGFAIPHEELFFPDEPDFVPAFLLEREPRLSWTIDDIRLYWRSPMNNDFWRDEVRRTVDDLMDGVP